MKSLAAPFMTLSNLIKPGKVEQALPIIKKCFIEGYTVEQTAEVLNKAGLIKHDTK